MVDKKHEMANFLKPTPGDVCPHVWKLLTLTRPIGLALHTLVAQKIADPYWLIANSSKKGTFFI